MSRKIIGVTVGTPLPKPNFKQTDPTKGDYIKNKPDFDGLKSNVEQIVVRVDTLNDLVGNTKVETQIGDAVSTLESEIDDKLNVMQLAIDSKVDVVEGKGLSTNDYTTAEKNKLATVEASANFYEHPTHSSHDLGLYKVTVDDKGHVSEASLVEKEDIIDFVEKDDILALGFMDEDSILSEISDLNDRIDGVENSINTTNTTLEGISQELESYKTANNEAVSTNAGNIEVNTLAIAEIKNDYLKLTDKTQLQDDVSKVSEKVTANTSAIEKLNGEGEGSVKQSIEDAFNKFVSDVNNDEAVNTYKELIEYVKDHGADFTALVGKVDSNTNNIGDLATDLSEYKDEVSEQFIDVNEVIADHANNLYNPHGVTVDQIGAAPFEHHHDDLYYDKDEILGLITVGDIDDICALDYSGGENVDPVTAATKYWVERYYQPKGDYLTAEDITAHNVSASSHNDIRLRIEEIADDFYTFADCDDETLSQLQEVVNYIKNNASLIESITTSKVSVSDIVNNLTTNVNNKPLSAAQGVVLKALIDAITVPTKVSELENDSGYLMSYTETDPTVPAWAKAETKPTYTASEVGAAPTLHEHTVTVTGTNESSAVTGTVTIPTVNKTQKYMTASATAPIVTPVTTSVLGADTQFTVLGGDTSTTKLAATASGVAVGASGTANAITGFGDHTTAAAITELNTTTINNPTVTPVSIPNVTGNDTVTASKVSATNGTAASWVASVSNGVLSFDWVANTPTEVTATDVSASKVTLGTDLSASNVSTSDVTVATGSKSTANAITALGTPTTAAALTGVEVTAQPTVTIAAGETGDVTVATGVGAISVTAIGGNVDAVTSVHVDAPAITLANNVTNVAGSVPVVAAVDIGTTSASIINGVAAAQKWTQSTGSTVPTSN